MALEDAQRWVLRNMLAASVLAHLFWAPAMLFGAQAAIPVAAVLFVIGRIFFAGRYTGSANSRAVGFALSFYPTVILTVSAFAWLIWRTV